MTEELEAVDPRFAIEHARRCVDHQRPVGWLVARELLHTIGELQAELAEKRDRGTAGEPRR